jgi:hypothetical protein
MRPATAFVKFEQQSFITLRAALQALSPLRCGLLHTRQAVSCHVRIHDL